MQSVLIGEAAVFTDDAACALQAQVRLASRLEGAQSLLQGAVVVLTVAHWVGLALELPCSGGLVRVMAHAAPALTDLAIVWSAMAFPLSIEAIITVGSNGKEFSSFEDMLWEATNQRFLGVHLPQRHMYRPQRYKKFSKGFWFGFFVVALQHVWSCLPEIELHNQNCAT